MCPSGPVAAGGVTAGVVAAAAGGVASAGGTCVAAAGGVCVAAGGSCAGAGWVAGGGCVSAGGACAHAMDASDPISAKPNRTFHRLMNPSFDCPSQLEPSECGLPTV